MNPANPARALLRGEQGITSVEFALVAPVLVLMIMGFFDLAHRTYATSVLQGAMQAAARDSTLESGLTSGDTIDDYVETRVRTVAGTGADFLSERLSYQDFAGVGQPERFVDASPFNDEYDSGECFEDVNGNGEWDPDLGKSGQGGAHDAVLYKMTVTYPRLFPMASLMGWPTEQIISAATVLRNQPYGNQTAPVYAVCP